MNHGEVRLEGAPALWADGEPEWISLSWEDEDGTTRHLLGSGVPEAISSSFKAYLEAANNGSVADRPAEWVLSLAGPSRGLFGKPGPAEGEVSFFWQEAADGSPAVPQTVKLSDLAVWVQSLDLYGSADPEEVHRPDRD
jgi:hypothetical protein